MTRSKGRSDSLGRRAWPRRAKAADAARERREAAMGVGFWGVLEDSGWGGEEEETMMVCC